MQCKYSVGKRAAMHGVDIKENIKNNLFLLFCPNRYYRSFITLYMVDVSTIRQFQPLQPLILFRSIRYARVLKSTNKN